MDVDVHHGDGVEDIFQSDPDVLTISLSSCDLVGHAYGPLSCEVTDVLLRADRGKPSFMPYTWDRPWLAAFGRWFRASSPLQPTVLVTQDSCDSHHLTRLRTSPTPRIWPRVRQVFHELAHELCEGRWLALGERTYLEVVPRAWTLLCPGWWNG